MAEDSAVADLENLYKQARSAKEPYVPGMYLDIAFFEGHQWCYWNNGRIDRPRMASWRRTPVDNRIAPIARARAAKKVKSKPVFVVTPATGEEDDTNAALIGEQVLEADWRMLDLGPKLYRALLFAEIMSAGFWKVTWDSTQGTSVEVATQNGQPLRQQNGTPVRIEMLEQMFPDGIPEGVSSMPLAQGDVAVDVRSPLEMFPDPLATSLTEAEWMIEEVVKSPEYIQKRYGVEVTPDASAPAGPVEERMSASLRNFAEGSAGGEYKGVKIKEMWSRPSTTHPKGRKCAWTHEGVLEETGEPFDPMPYVMFSGITVPSRFWPMSLTSQLRPPQVELNKLEAQIAENAARLGNPSLAKSRQANVKYSGLPGEEILYDDTVPNSVPTFITPPEMPSYVQNQLDRIENSISEISGIHDVSKGNVPAGLNAASAINLLQEADDTTIGPEIQDMENALAGAGTKVLKLRAALNSDERLVKIAGEEGNWDIFSFKGAMLGDDPHVEVQSGSGMPRSKAAKQAAMTELLSLALQYGIQIDPRSMRNFFKEYEVGGLDRLFEDLSKDEQQVTRENRLLMQGIALNINSYDTDQIHVDSHTDFQKTAQYARLIVENPQVGIGFDAHIAAHRERMVQGVNAQVNSMQQQLPMPQLPPGQSNPST